MNKYYFTYGTASEFPFRGGWTEIHSPNIRAAADIFKALHPNRNDSSILNCADYYTEEAFNKTEMPTKGNLGAYCHEIIKLEVTKP